MERARSDMLRLAGIDQRAAMEAGDGAWAVTDLAIKYRRPAKLDDALLVVSPVAAVRGASAMTGQSLLRRGEKLTNGRAPPAFPLHDARRRHHPAASAVGRTTNTHGNPTARTSRQ